MSVFDWLSKLSAYDFSTFGEDSNCSSSDDFVVNPATGIPMTAGMGSFDYEGNPFGMDLNEPVIGSVDVFDSFGQNSDLQSFDD